MELKFTPRTIKELEDITKKPISDVLSDMSVSNIAKVVMKGAGLGSIDEALDMMEKEFNEQGNDLYNLYVDIMEKLQDAGFFPKGVNLENLRNTLNKKMENIDTLELNGSETNQQQSE